MNAAFKAAAIGSLAISVAVAGYVWVSDEPTIPKTAVVMRRMGSDAAKKVTVYKMGPYCAVAWYSSIENLLMHRDGSVNDDIMKYTWTLDGNTVDPGKNQAWFDQNCVEPSK